MSTTLKRDKELARKAKAQQKRVRKQQRRRQAQQQNFTTEKPISRTEGLKMFNRSKIEIDDREEIKKTIVLLSRKAKVF